MTEFYFPFASLNGDRETNDTHFARFYSNLFRDGVIAPVKGALKVSEDNVLGSRVLVESGAMLIDGRQYMLTEPRTVQIKPAESTGDRTDLVVVRLDLNARLIELRYLENATNPVRTEQIWDMVLARISVPRNATEIKNADITDMRANDAVCGYSTPYEEIKVSGLEQQYQSLLEQSFDSFEQHAQQNKQDLEQYLTDQQLLFENWFESVKGILDENVATSLLNMINAHELKEATETELGHVRLSDIPIPTKESIGLGNVNNVKQASKEEHDQLKTKVDEHQAEKVHQGEIHGFRLTDSKLEYFDGAEWQRVKGDGYPVGNVVDFTASVGNGEVTLKWGDPSNVTVEDSNGNVITIAQWAGTKLVRKTGNFPVDESDGVLLVDNTTRNKHQTTGFKDTGRVNGTTYYYMLFPYTQEDVVTVDGANRASATPQAYDDLTGSPGPSNLIGGTMQAGFFGEVPASELFTASQMASAVGITWGTAQHENEPWLKFAHEGKILFRPRKAIRHSVSWDAINTAKCVYGGSDGKIVTKDGKQYRVRLMRGALTDPSKYSDADRGAKGSEWNKLMLPIHEQAIDKSWAYLAYVEENVPIWAHNLGTGSNGMYSDADLLTHNTHGNGSYVWQQETASSDASLRVLRGLLGVSLSNSSTSSSTLADFGWAPVLELL